MSFVYALIVGIIPSVVWFFILIVRKNTHPELWKRIFKCVGAGMVALIVAGLLQQLIDFLPAGAVIHGSIAAAIEEILKLAVAIWFGLKSAQFERPIDAMIYLIAVAIGFMTLENILYTYFSIVDATVTQGIWIGLFRAITSSVGHMTSSACVGFAIGYTFYRSFSMKTIATIGGLVVAIIIHAVFNIIITTHEGTLTSLLAIPWVWIAAAVILPLLFRKIKNVAPSNVAR